MTNVHDLYAADSVIHSYVMRLRDVSGHGNREEFRNNLRRIGRVIGYEISKTLGYEKRRVRTPLAECLQSDLKDSVVAVTVLRAGLAMHDGILDVFPEAENGFISAYRRHKPDGSFHIFTGYVTCPDLEGKVLIISDPMLATGQSFIAALDALKSYGQPKSIHLAATIASETGVQSIKDLAIDNLSLWFAAIDPDLNAEKYIVPGLGDAGDLAFGPKLQR